MSKVDFEYYPHIVDLIWEHIPASEVYLAGQVSSSWRERALKRVYRHLTIEMCDRGWRFWMWTPDAEDIYAKYFVPCQQSDRFPNLWQVVPERHPAFSFDLAARYTEVLDLREITDELRLGDPPLKLDEAFPRLHTLRMLMECGGEAEVISVAATQVYSWYSSEFYRVNITAHNANCIVLTIRVERPEEWFSIFDGEARLSEQLQPVSFTADKLVIVFESDRYSFQHRFSCDEVIRDVLNYLGETWASFSITIVGAEILLQERSEKTYASLKSAILLRLESQSSDHGVQLLTHAEYEARVGHNTYQLHCVSNFGQWFHCVRD